MDRTTDRSTAVRVPLVECAHDARQEKEMMPKRVANILAQEDAKAARQAS